MGKSTAEQPQGACAPSAGGAALLAANVGVQ